jgi:2-dehydro-3-deoxygluconokinase
MIERRLLAEGVRALVTRDDAFTGLMVKHRRSASVTSVDYHRTGSSGSRLRPGDLPDGLVEGAGVLHVTGITPALSVSAREAVFEAVARARRAGVPVSLDVNYRRKLWGPDAAGPVLRELVRDADLVFAGVAEAQLLVGTEEKAPALLADALAALGPGHAVIKDGPRGCTALIDGVPRVVPALTVHVIDPVGAGDAFVAGYLAEFLAGEPVMTRLRTAVAAGAFAVGVPGDCEGLPRRADLDALHMSAWEDVNR